MQFVGFFREYVNLIVFDQYAQRLIYAQCMASIKITKEKRIYVVSRASMVIVMSRGRRC